jgi:hypothetical protein
MRVSKLIENTPAIAPGFSFLDRPILPAAGLLGAGQSSDHPLVTDGSGPSWVAAMTFNTVERSRLCPVGQTVAKYFVKPVDCGTGGEGGIRLRHF